VLHAYLADKNCYDKGFLPLVIVQIVPKENIKVINEEIIKKSSTEIEIGTFFPSHIRINRVNKI
jgi:hypothetical protein